MLRVRDSPEPKNADSATGKRQKRAQWANANGKTPGVTSWGHCTDSNEKKRPGKEQAGRTEGRREGVVSIGPTGGVNHFNPR